MSRVSTLAEAAKESAKQVEKGARGEDARRAVALTRGGRVFSK